MLNDEVMNENPRAAAALLGIREQARSEGVDLAERFREADKANTGELRKDEFERVLFESLNVQGEELRALVELICPAFEDVINFHDFLQIMYRFGEQSNMPPVSGRKVPSAGASVMRVPSVQGIGGRGGL